MSDTETNDHDDDLLLGPDDEPAAKPARAGSGTDGPTEDDLFWETTDEAREPRSGNMVWIQVGLAALAVIVIAGILLTRGSNDEDDSGGGGSNDTEQTADGSGGGDATPARPSAPWPGYAGGRPPALGPAGTLPADVPADAAPGVYVWSDYQGWHLWVVNGEGVTGVSGTVISNDTMAKATLVEGSAGTAEPNGAAANFALPAEPRVSGFDFNPGFFSKQISFDLQGPAGPIPAEQIKTGSKAVAAKLPLVIERLPKA